MIKNDNFLLFQALSVLVVFPLVLIAAGCASSKNTLSGKEVSVRYAQVKSIEKVKQPSNAPAGAIMGGFLGLMLSSGQSGRTRLASGLGGAALGAVSTSALEGDREAFSYTLRYNDNSESRFVTVKGFFEVGDCVAVERGYTRGEQYNNARRVPAEMCSQSRLSEEPSEIHKQRARQCLEAKEQLLAAESKDSVESAAQKVSILCQ